MRRTTTTASTRANSLNAVQDKQDRPASCRLAHAEDVAKALGSTSSSRWQPNVEGFYGRLSKAALLRIVSEAQAPMAISISALKKAEVVRYVAQAVAERNWLPAPLCAA